MPAPVVAQDEGMVDQRPVSVLRRMMEAVNRGDAQTYARLYAPDAPISIHGSGQILGRNAIEAYENG